MEQNMKHFVLGTQNQVTIADIWQEKGYQSPDCDEDSEATDKKMSWLVANGEGGEKAVNLETEKPPISTTVDARIDSSALI